MKIKELISALSSPDNLRIMRGEQQVYIGYLANLNNREHEIDWQRAGLTGEEEVKSFRTIPDISHKRWEELHLLPPIEPERLAEYRFSDLQMTIYYTIYI